MTPTKKIAIIAMLVAQASVLHFLESLLPNPIPIPGVKLGLANIITLMALMVLDFRTALTITVLRTILGSLLSGTLFGVGFLMSFSGALSALCLMALFLRVFTRPSIVFISMLGAAAHNLGQLGMAMLILGFPGIFYYLPVMLLFSVPTGYLTGLLARELIVYISRTGRVAQLFQDN